MTRKLLILIFGLCCTACSQLQFPGVFKIDINQGNFITSEMLAQLQPGMSRSQVTFILGPPMLEDTFNADRWDYYTSNQKGKDARSSSHITLYFKGDQYSHYRGNINTPSNSENPPAPKNPSK